MRIEGKITGGHYLHEVDQGEAFLCNGTVYIRTSMISVCNLQVVNLETGEVCSFFPNTAVTPIKAKVVVE